jgi:hypothetical protein
MKKGLLLLIGLLIVTSFSSCKKDEEVKEPTKEELLKAHVWKGIDVVVYDANGTETGRQAIPQIEFLFAVNNDYFIYDSGDISGYGDWSYAKGSPDKLTLTPNSSSRPSMLPMIKNIQYRGVLAPTVCDVEKLTKDKFSFSIVDNGSKYEYNFKK